MMNWKVCSFLLSAHFFQGLFCKSIYLFPSQTDVLVNNNFTFTCTYNGYIEVTGTKWNVQGKYTPSVVRNEDGTCSGSGIFANNSIYEVGCPSKTSFTVTILRVQLDDHGAQWICFDRERESNNVTMFVKVPVRNVTLSGPSSRLFKEHSKQTFRCETSIGRPQPYVDWFILEYTGSVKHEITVNSSTQIISSTTDGLVAVKSLLRFYPNKTVNNWMLYCESWIDNETSAIFSNQFTLNITYPPDSPPVILGYEDGKMYTLIESEVGELSCSISSGNPLPNLTWICYNSKPALSTVDGNIVMSNVTLIAFRNQSSCSCVSNHPWSGVTQSTTVSIHILFPPQKPTLKVNSANVTGTIDVIINKNLNVICESEGNPLPNYTWTGPLIGNVLGKELNVTINSKNDRTYKCRASNVMTSFENMQTDGRNETALTVKVLYPPEKPFFKYGHIHGQLISHDMLEVFKGESFSIYCDAIGNPPPTVFWDNNYTNESVINIQSIRSAINKTCTARNKMKETVGENRDGVSKSTLIIKVFTPSKIQRFYVKAKKSNGAFIVNETSMVSFVCSAEGYPASDIIVISPEEKTILNITNLNCIDLVLINVSYVNAGEYTCIGQNIYNTDNQSSKSKLILIVRCPPRPSSGDYSIVKIIAILNEDVLLQFTAYDYLDEPNNTVFTWFQHHQSVQNDGGKITISSDGMQSNLTIKNITREDIGQIAVHVSNSVGKYIHFYEILLKDKPDQPLYFNVIENSITDSSVTLSWTAGFNGGETQVFILIYKMSSGDNWKSTTIQDNGFKQRNFTLRGLSRMTVYDAKMFSRNEVGDSHLTPSLNFETKAGVSQQQSGTDVKNLGIFVGVGVGTFVGTILIVVVTLICYKCFRKDQNSARKAIGNTKDSQNAFTYENLDSTENRENENNRVHTTPTYESIDSALQELSSFKETDCRTQEQNQTSEYINTNI